MANDRQNLLDPSSGADWDKAWDVVNRLGTARKHLTNDALAGETASSAETAAPLAPITARSLHRPIAVWILIGALWISIGMIISAAIVTVAFLA